MNYYKRHLGDYSRDTAHLSQGQAGAYDLLLDWYYANERPLPLDEGDLYRIARAFTPDERRNVAKVMSFFTKCPDGYRQKRADLELADMQSRRAVNRKVAVDREAKRSGSNLVTFQKRKADQS